MKNIDRTMLKYLVPDLFGGKALIVMGPRQSGKTTLVNMLLAQQSQKSTLYLNADDPFLRNQWANPSLALLRQMIGHAEIVFIDEAQRLENIGILIKMIVDQIPGVQVIATGSSSFDLANKINEPLTGRKFEYTLFPLSYAEMVQTHGRWAEQQLLEQRLIYGYYPEVVTSPGKEEKLLLELADSYLFKDIYSLEKISKPILLENIVRALALQIGREVSVTELSQLVSADRATVEKYLDLLCKAFVIFMIPALHRNLRNEIKKNRKYYFWDNGILNALLGNFYPLNSRPDGGALWENFAVSERIKQQRNSLKHSRFYFWRTSLQQEIDLIEEDSARYSAYEIKLNPRKSVRFPSSFLAAYPIDDTMTVTPETFGDFILGPSDTLASP